MDVKQAALSPGFSPRNYSSIAASYHLKKPRGSSLSQVATQQESIYAAVTYLDWVMKKLVRIVKAGIADNETMTEKYVKNSLRAT